MNINTKKISHHIIQSNNEYPNISERVNKLYLPIIKRLLKWLKTTKKPLIVGVNGSQGIGKSTLTKVLTNSLNEFGIRTVTISIDDFYHTRKKQISIANKYKNNPYLKDRGYPGTHDIALGESLLNALMHQKKSKVRIPLYDKSKYQGKGDRVLDTEWKETKTPIDLILFEGWMLGFESLANKKLGKHLNTINKLLKDYQSWHDLIDKFIYLVPSKNNHVINWRVEAEEKMKASGKTGMSTEEIKKYISNFLPAYDLYLPKIKNLKPDHDRHMKFIIKKDRLPIETTHKK